MGRVGKKYRKAREAVAAKPVYPLPEAVAAVAKNAFAKFDETVEVAMRLGVDPKHADQMVRGTVVLPHGLGGKSKRVLVIASGEKLKEAQDAGADIVGGDDMVAKIQEGWLDFDAVVATPDMMKSVGRLGKVLGPRGLMPNPKTGTVTFEVAKAIREIKAGKVEFRVDKTAIVHAPVGKVSFGAGEAAREREDADRQRDQGQAGGREGQVREVDRAVVHDGPRGAGRPRLRRRPRLRAGENMNRTEKQELIDELHKEFEASPHAVLVDFRGLSVPAVTEFRRKVKAAGSRYRVVKNSLALRAAKGTPLESLGDQLVGTTGIAYTGDRPGGAGEGPGRLRQGPPGARSQGWASCRAARRSTRPASRTSAPCRACRSCARGSSACCRPPPRSSCACSPPPRPSSRR